MKTFYLLILIVSLSFSKTDNIVIPKNMTIQINSYLSEHYFIKKPKKPFTLKASIYNKTKEYAFVEAILLYEDDSYIELDYIEDIVFSFCLEKVQSKWNVIYDLSRTDVPSDEELEYMKKNFPPQFPKELLNKYWRKKL